MYQVRDGDFTSGVSFIRDLRRYYGCVVDDPETIQLSTQTMDQSVHFSSLSPNKT